MKLPDGPFSVIVADPPWTYGFSRSKSRRVDNHYATMSLAEIVSLDVDGIAAPDSVLFLWATSPKVDVAVDVMRAWGFKHVTCAVWRKPSIGPGFWWRQQHELVLLGKRGSPPVPRPELRTSSVFDAPRRRHSEKPEDLQDTIDSWYPAARKLEMFARRPRAGWEVWGLEAGGTP